jgi:hypothetical protein
MHNCTSAKLAKSLRSGVHDSDHNLKLEEGIQKGDAATRLAEACSKRPVVKNYLQMKSDLETLCEASIFPTINVARQFVIETANHALSSGNTKVFCQTLRCWQYPSEQSIDQDPRARSGTHWRHRRQSLPGFGVSTRAVHVVRR